MLRKFLSIVFSTFISLDVCAESTSEPSVFFHANLGQCFEDTSLFFQNVLGETSTFDENISFTRKGSWTWIIGHDKNHPF